MLDMRTLGIYDSLLVVGSACHSTLTRRAGTKGYAMAKFNMVVPHGLPQGEALRRIQGEVENLKREYGDQVGNLRDSWRDDSLRPSAGC